MKKGITLILVAFAFITTNAQQKADIEVSYTAHRINLRNSKEDLTNQYILLANTKESKFFSPKTQYIDSLKATPDGKAKINEIATEAISKGDFNNIPRGDGTYYVVKSFVNGNLKHYDSAGPERYVYDEPLQQWNWEIGDSTKVILGYECIMATTEYHGRNWTAWFSPEIPVKNGPWKLDGLPGLILKAETKGGQYSFIATGIQQTDKPIGPVYLANEYEHVTRIDYLKSWRSFMDNPLGTLNAKFSDGFKVISNRDNNESNDLFVPASVADFLETDYH